MGETCSWPTRWSIAGKVFSFLDAIRTAFNWEDSARLAKHFSPEVVPIRPLRPLGQKGAANSMRSRGYLAAFLDRINRGRDASAISNDPRLDKVRRALEVLHDQSGGR